MNSVQVEVNVWNDDHPQYRRAVNLAKMTALHVGGICFAAIMKFSQHTSEGHPKLHPSVVGWWRAGWDRRMAWDRHMNDDSA